MTYFLHYHRQAIAIAVLAFSLIGLQADAALALSEGSTRIHDMQRGDIVTHYIEITNTSDTDSIEFNAYQTDYFFELDCIDYGDPGTVARSNAKWFRFLSPLQQTLEPRQSVKLRYEITAPNDLEDGTYWSVIMVEPAEDPTPMDPDAPGFHLLTKVRHASQIVTHIGDGGTEALALEQVSMATVDGKPMLQFELEATGTRWLRPEIWIEIFDAEGNEKGRFPAVSRRRVYPGCRVSHQIDLSSLSAATYHGILVISCEQRAFASQTSLTLK